MHDEEFLIQQGDILKALAHALVNATPETWDEATLELEVGDEGLGHTITSAAHRDEIVTATDDVFAQTMALQDLFESRGQSFRTAEIRVYREDRDGVENWKFKVKFAY
jgi:hypothetical protein